MDYLTTSDLLDIVESQPCIYGNQPLYVKASAAFPNNYPHLIAMLCAADNEVLQCISKDDTYIDDFGLLAVAERLSQFAGDEEIENACDTSSPFQVGFYADECFVETVNSEELRAQTKIEVED